MSEATTYTAKSDKTPPTHDFFVASAINVAILQAVKELTPPDKRTPRPTLYHVLDRAWEIVRDARGKNAQNLVLRDAEYYLLCRKNTADSHSRAAAVANGAFWAGAAVAHNAIKLGAILAGAEEHLRADPDQVSSPPGLSSIDWSARGSRHGVNDVGASSGSPRLLNPNTLELLGAVSRAGSGAPSAPEATVLP